MPIGTACSGPGTPEINTCGAAGKNDDGYAFVKKEFAMPVPKDREAAVKPYAARESFTYTNF